MSKNNSNRLEDCYEDCECNKCQPEQSTEQKELITDELGTNIVSLIGPLDMSQTNKILTHISLLIESITPEEQVIFNICTPGGDAYSMFGIYDLMRVLRSKCTLKTFGLGSVMSAGVLLLSAGTPGERYVGKHTQLMVHKITGQSFGNTHQVEAELKQMTQMSNIYADALSEETKQNIKVIKKLLNKKSDVFLNSEEAVKLGLADKIL